MNTEKYKSEFDSIMSGLYEAKAAQKKKNRVCLILLAAAILGFVLSIVIIKSGVKFAFLAAFLILGAVSVIIMKNAGGKVSDAADAAKPELNDKVFLPMLTEALNAEIVGKPGDRMRQLVESVNGISMDDSNADFFSLRGERAGKRFEVVTGYYTVTQEKKDEIVTTHLDAGTHVLLSDPGSHDAVILMDRLMTSLVLSEGIVADDIPKVKLDVKLPFKVRCADQTAAFRFMTPVKMEKLKVFDKEYNADYLLAEKDSFYAHARVLLIVPDYVDPKHTQTGVYASDLIRLGFESLKTAADEQAAKLNTLIDNTIAMSRRPAV